MSLHEIEHPLGRDVDEIHTAVSLGFMDQVIDQNTNLKINYENPIDSGIGVATLRIADWATENAAVIYYPLHVDPGDATWQVVSEDGFAPVRHRVMVRDLLGRGFPMYVGEEKKVSTYIQWDIIDEGVIMSFEHEGEKTAAYGVYESERYDALAFLARRQSSITALIDLARAA